MELLFEAAREDEEIYSFLKKTFPSSTVGSVVKLPVFSELLEAVKEAANVATVEDAFVGVVEWVRPIARWDCTQGATKLSDYLTLACVL